MLNTYIWKGEQWEDARDSQAENEDDGDYVGKTPLIVCSEIVIVVLYSVSKSFCQMKHEAWSMEIVHKIHFSQHDSLYQLHESDNKTVPYGVVWCVCVVIIW